MSHFYSLNFIPPGFGAFLVHLGLKPSIHANWRLPISIAHDRSLHETKHSYCQGEKVQFGSALVVNACSLAWQQQGANTTGRHWISWKCLCFGRPTHMLLCMHDFLIEYTSCTLDFFDVYVYSTIFCLHFYGQTVGVRRSLKGPPCWSR